MIKDVVLAVCRWSRTVQRRWHGKWISTEDTLPSVTLMTTISTL